MCMTSYELLVQIRLNPGLGESWLVWDLIKACKTGNKIVRFKKSTKGARDIGLFITPVPKVS